MSSAETWSAWFRGMAHRRISFRASRSMSRVEGSMAAPPAAAELDLILIDGVTLAVTARHPLLVTEPEATVTAPARVAPGESIEVAWSGPEDQEDFVSLALAGSPDLEYIEWARVEDGNPSVLRAPSAPGEYELRYVDGEKGEVRARDRHRSDRRSDRADGSRNGDRRHQVRGRVDGAGHARRHHLHQQTRLCSQPLSRVGLHHRGFATHPRGAIQARHLRSSLCRPQRPRDPRPIPIEVRPMSHRRRQRPGPFSHHLRRSLGAATRDPGDSRSRASRSRRSPRPSPSTDSRPPSTWDGVRRCSPPRRPSFSPTVTPTTSPGSSPGCRRTPGDTGAVRPGSWSRTDAGPSSSPRSRSGPIWMGCAVASISTRRW